MNVSGLIDQLTQQGVQVWADDGKLKIQSPKGVMTSELQSELVARKAEILEFLLQKNSPTETCLPGHQGLSLQTIGRLIGGAEA
jgi:TubC N-terminal docking domain